MKLPGITKPAALAIRRLIDSLPDWDEENNIPGVAWLIDSTDGEPPGPCIGCHPRREIPPEDIMHGHGTSVACFLPERLIEKYQDHMLHFAEGRFVFIDRTMASFLLVDWPGGEAE